MDKLHLNKYDFFVGVPDSALKPILKEIEKTNKKHIISCNEAHAVAIAFGAILAGSNPCVYLQNSGLGNIINPLTSLCIPSGIEPFLLIGHRHTLEQHKIMGKIDEEILKILNYQNYYLFKGENNVK
tara:strand:- start:120 stop:500 length:381 start_codon:yes stop_codon:yes gene_type:complete